MAIIRYEDLYGDAKRRYGNLGRRLLQYMGVVAGLYDVLTSECAYAAGLTGYDGSEPFHFRDFPMAGQQYRMLINAFTNDLCALIDRGTRAEWQASENEHDAFVRNLYNAYNAHPETYDNYGMYLRHNDDARDEFLKQQRSGTHGWSARVWALNDQTQKEMEMAISASYADGTSAAELATQMKQYLNEPDKLFRRVRDEFGELQLSKNAEAYHPGPGVYRSSYKNALRLTRSEINMSYRKAEQVRYEKEDFVVGYEIHLSQSHPEHDVCDTLAGKYPKGFIWSGWHPNDMCFMTPVLKTEDEFFNDDENARSVNQVDAPPEAFTQYLEENQQRLEAARQRGTLPFWVRDNYTIHKNSMTPNWVANSKNA